MHQTNARGKQNEKSREPIQNQKPTTAKWSRRRQNGSPPPAYEPRGARCTSPTQSTIYSTTDRKPLHAYQPGPAQVQAGSDNPTTIIAPRNQSTTSKTTHHRPPERRHTPSLADRPTARQIHRGIWESPCIRAWASSRWRCGLRRACEVRRAGRSKEAMRKSTSYVLEEEAGGGQAPSGYENPHARGGSSSPPSAA